MKKQNDKMTQAMQLGMINQLIPSTRNLGENLKLIEALGIERGLWGSIVKGDPTVVHTMIINPADNEPRYIDCAIVKITAEKSTGDACISINDMPVEQFFAELDEKGSEECSIEKLVQENLMLKKLVVYTESRLRLAEMNCPITM